MSNKKNMLGMDLTEWKHLSGLADPYALALAEAGVAAGVPRVVIKEDDDDPSGLDVAQKQDKAARLIAIKRAARNLRGKTRNAAEKAATTPAKDRYKTALELAKHRKTFLKAEDIEDFDPDIMWAVYLESIGTSADEFGTLLDLAIMNEDEEMTIELLSVEDQLDEIFGAIGAGLAKGAQAVGRAGLGAAKAVGQGALAAGKGLANAAGQIGQSAVQGFKAAAGSAAPAGGGQPAGATSAGAPSAPAGASAPAQAAAPAGAAAPAQAPTQSAGANTAQAGQQKQPGLLGTLARGIGKVARGVTNMAMAPARGAVSMGKQVAAGYRGEDIEAFEAYLGEEFGITAEQYIELCDEAFAAEDQDMIESVQQLEGLFDSWRKKKEAAAQEKNKQGMETVRQAVVGIKKVGGLEQSKKIARHGLGVPVAKAKKPEPKAGSGTTLNQSADVGDAALQIMESSGALAPREKSSDLKALISSQLQYSGYTDEYIEGRSKAQQYHGMMAQHPDKGIQKIAASPEGKKQAASLVTKTKDKKNELAPQLIKAFRKDNKAGKVER